MALVFLLRVPGREVSRRAPESRLWKRRRRWWRATGGRLAPQKDARAGRGGADGLGPPKTAGAKWGNKAPVTCRAASV